MKEDKAMLLYETLVSDKYKQGKDYLHPLDGTFCVLGVACEISNLGKWTKVEYDRLSYEVIESSSLRSVEDSELPKTVQEYFGFFDVNGTRRDGATIILSLGEDPIEYACLVDANDSGESFISIAKYIQENWMHL
jgi:hypothetical protein